MTGKQRLKNAGRKTTGKTRMWERTPWSWQPGGNAALLRKRHRNRMTIKYSRQDGVGHDLLFFLPGKEHLWV